jgi:AcrR family transcriptional regulator
MNAKSGTVSAVAEHNFPGWGREPQNREEQSNLKRLAILRTAAQLFNEQGYRETSLNELASRLKVTKPTLYYYVKNKDDILRQVLQQAMLDIDPIIAHAEETGTNGLDKLRLFVQQYVVWLTGDFGKCLVLSGITPLEQASRNDLRPSFKRIDMSVRKMFMEGMQDGSINPRDAKVAAFALFGAMHWVTSWFRADGELNPAQIADEIFSVFDTGLRSDTTKPKKPARRTASKNAVKK